MKDLQNGWIKVHRKIMDKGYYKKSQYVHLWIHILLKASHDESEFMWNGKIAKLMPGQFITGRQQLSADTGISQSTVERILETLENEHQIGQQKTNRFRLLTVINWLQYQKTGQQNGQPADNQRTTSGQPADTFKKRKNVRIKEIKNKKPRPIFQKPTIDEIKAYILEKKYTVNPDQFLARYESNGWMVGKNPMKDWRATIRYWQANNFDNGGSKKPSTAWGGIAPSRTETNEEYSQRMIGENKNRIKNLSEYIKMVDEARAKYGGESDPPTEKKYMQIKKEIKEIEEELADLEAK